MINLIHLIRQKQNFFIFLLSLLPIVIMGLLIAQNAINVPWVDQWNTPGAFFISNYEGNLTYDYWFSQHNESRLLLYRLISIPLAYLTNWDVRYEVAVIFLVACGISTGLFRLLDITCKTTLRTKLLLWFLMNLLIFSPAQLDVTGNWLMGIQMIMFLVVLFIIIGILLCYSKLNNITKFSLCALLCFFSTYTFANGLLAWVILFPSLFLLSASSWSEVLKQRKLILGWLACFILNVYFYTRNFQKPYVASDSPLSLEQPFEFMQFFFSLLGAPLGGKSTIASQFLGTIFFFTFLLLLGILFIYRSNFKLIQNSVGWFSLGLYSLLSSALIGYGRLGDGLGASLYAKYTTATLYFVVALVGLGYLALCDANNFKDKKVSNIFYKIVEFYLIFLIGLGLLLNFASFPQSIKLMKQQRLHYLAGKACLLFTKVLENDECLEKYVYPLIVVDQWNSIDYVKKAVKIFEEINLFYPKLVSSKNLNAIKIKLSDDKLQGEFIELSKVNDKQYLAKGYLTAKSNSSYGGIILVYTPQDPQLSKVFALADVDFSNGVKSFQPWTEIKWQATFDLEDLPSGPLEISAWAIDSNTGELIKLDQSQPHFSIINTLNVNTSSSADNLNG